MIKCIVCKTSLTSNRLHLDLCGNCADRLEEVSVNISLIDYIEMVDGRLVISHSLITFINDSISD